MMTMYNSQMKVPWWHEPLSTSSTTNIFDSNLRRLRCVPNDVDYNNNDNENNNNDDDNINENNNDENNNDDDDDNNDNNNNNDDDNEYECDKNSW